MRKYIPEETKWLEKQEKFINRWDFKFFEPWYIKESAYYQLVMYKGYRDDAQSLVDIVDFPEKAKIVKPGQVTDERERRDAYSDKYFALFDKYSKINDWRKILATVPFPEKCNEENLRIPDTSGTIDWDRNPLTPVPTQSLIDPELTS